MRSSPRPPNSQPGGSLPFPFHRQGGTGTKRSARQVQQSRLRRDREGANQAQVSHHRRPPALQRYGDPMRATHVLQAFSSRKGSTGVQIPEDRQTSAHRPAISPSSHSPRDGAGAGRGPEVRPVRHPSGPLGLKRMRKPGPGRLLPGLVQPFFRASCLAAALLAGMAVCVVLGPVPGSDWRSGFTSTHSAARRCAGAAMTMYLGTGLLSQQAKRGVAGSCCTASVPGTGGSPGLMSGADPGGLECRATGSAQPTGGHRRVAI